MGIVARIKVQCAVRPPDGNGKLAQVVVSQFARDQVIEAGYLRRGAILARPR